jgi:transcriptional regulator with XRE-family HTH domain
MSLYWRTKPLKKGLVMTIKELIQKKRIKQVEIAKALGLEPSRVNLFINEIRPIPPRHLPKLAQILDVTLEEAQQLISKQTGNNK